MQIARTLVLAATVALGATTAYASDGFKDIMNRDDVTTNVQVPAPMYERNASWTMAEASAHKGNAQDPFYFRKTSESNDN